MCCPCFNDFTNYIKSFFVKNEEQINRETQILVDKLVPILLPIIKNEIENLVNSKIPLQIQPITNEIINTVL